MKCHTLICLFAIQALIQTEALPEMGTANAALDDGVSGEVRSAAYYVVDQAAPNAADSNPGTEQMPFKTVQHAAEVVQPGETVYVMAGQYEERVKVKAGGTEGKPVAFALFFHNFSTFLGRPGIYLEDLYVKEEYRGMGFGKTILKTLAKLAKDRGCKRMEWSCLDWNAPSIGFYKSLGSIPMDEWTIYRLQGEALDRLAEGSN